MADDEFMVDDLSNEVYEFEFEFFVGIWNCITFDSNL